MRPLILAIAFFAGSASVPAQQVRIGVLGLFKPHEFVVKPVNGAALTIHAGKEMFKVEESLGVGSVRLCLEEQKLRVMVGSKTWSGWQVLISERDGNDAEFSLSVPGKFARHYRGILEIKPDGDVLTADVRMDLEEAVASIVAAENTPDTPLEAAKAQAIATRSYLVALPARHHEYDFCDTTHCQFLREPPAGGTLAARATQATQGLILSYQFRPFPAMYTRSCSGQTRTPAQVGMPPARNYPYFEVDCPYCRQHPQRWQTRIPAEDAHSLRAEDESSRLHADRHLGWQAIPSNTFTMTEVGSEVLVTGTGSGHGIGLCQRGARAMAEQGHTFHEILLHYYPNTEVRELRDIPQVARRISAVSE